MGRLANLAEQLDRRPERIAAILFALAIPFTYLSNILFYYIGLCFEENSARSVLFILLIIGYALACGLLFLYTLRRRRLGIRELIPLGIVLLFFAVAYVSSWLKFGLTAAWTENISQFICIAVPGFLAGACGGAWRAEGRFLPLLERISFFLIPAAVIYLVGAVFQCNPYNYGANLGIIGYMNFAYTLMPFLMVLCLRFAAGEEMRAPLSGDPYLRPRLVRGGMIALFWLAIMATGCRGPILCIVFFCVLLVIASLLRVFIRKRTVALAAMMLGVLMINVFVFNLPGMSRLDRIDIFLNGLLEGKLSTSSAEVLPDGTIDSMVSTSPEETTPPKEPSTSDQTPEEAPTEETEIGNRGTLLKLGWKEFLKAPLVGMGVLGFPLKYGMYSHSVLLDLLCETGILGTIIMLGLLLLSAFRIVRNSRQVVVMLLILISYGVAANISGYVWTYTPLLFALGYGLSLRKETTGPDTEIKEVPV